MAGIELYMSAGTFLNIQQTQRYMHRCNIVEPQKVFTIGNFKVLPFDLRHDAAEPLGFLIRYKDGNSILACTDTYYIPYMFTNLNNLLIEVNYSEAIIRERIESGVLNVMQARRTRANHMSLETAIKFLKSLDLTNVNNIILIHLSDGNSHAENFKQAVTAATGKTCLIADKNMTIDLSLTPF